MFAKLAMTEAQLADTRESPSGPLKVTTTVAFGTLWLVPRIPAFLERYPEIQVSLVVDDAELDLAMRQADVAIRVQPPRQPDLVQRHLMTLHWKVYASPGYLERFGTPRSAEELDGHRLIVFGEDAKLPAGSVNWLLEAGARPERPRRPVLTVNSVYGIFRACQHGLGIAALPDYLSRDADHLVAILPELRGPAVEAYFVYPEELRHSKRVAVFRDFLVSKIAEQPGQATPAAATAAV